MSWQGHLKVTTRSNNTKQVKITFLLLFSYNYVHFRCPWWFETYLDLNADQSTPPPTPICYHNISGRGFYPPPFPFKQPFCRHCLIWQNGPNNTLMLYFDQWPIYINYIWQSTTQVYMVKGSGARFYGVVTPRSWQSHLKVKESSNQHKTGEKSLFVFTIMFTLDVYDGLKHT